MIKKRNLIFLICGLIFLAVNFWLVTPVAVDPAVGYRFDWPDETANYFWIQQYAQTGQLFSAEPLNELAKNQIHPRSFNVRPDGSLVPGSFLGLIIFYGMVAKVLGTRLIIYLTPVLAMMAVLAFYGIIKQIFNQRIAMVSAILMMIHPAWWYYSLTSMLPNVAFVSLLIFGSYFLVTYSKEKFYYLILAGGFLGLALSVRPADISLVLVIFLGLLAYKKDHLNFSKVILIVVMIGLPLVPMFYQQKLVYGSFTTTGYSQLENSDSVGRLCETFKSLIMPFGFHPRLVWHNLFNYYFKLFWPYAILSLLGALLFIKDFKNQVGKKTGYLILTLLVTGAMGIYYGSWQFSDLLTVNLNTIGLSYVRYWLPLYLLTLPLIAMAIDWLAGLFKKRFSNVILLLVILFLGYSSAQLVLWQRPESFLVVKERVSSYQALSAEVSSLTEVQSIIVTSRKDKVFFPDRKVIHTFDRLVDNQELQKILSDLSGAAPLYYYALGRENDFKSVAGLELEEVQLFGQEVLYKIIKQ